MTTTKPIPLNEQPAYQAAIGKVVEIGRALDANNESLARAQAELYAVQKSSKNEAGALDRAMAIASGKSQSADAVPATLIADIQRLESEHKTLKEGLLAANAAADDVADGLSREVGLLAREKHAAKVNRILGCLEALCAANREEEEIRDGLERLGYHRHGLPHKGFMSPGRIDDRSGSPAYYYAIEAMQYIGNK